MVRLGSSRRGDASKKPSPVPFIAAIAVIVAVVVGLVLFFGGNAGDPTRGDADLRRQLEGMREIEYNGAKYRQKKNITTILLMGIDQFSTVDVGNSMRNGGQADFLRLLVIDNDEHKVRQLAIDRDTMTPITILGVLGDNFGTRVERISLSHGFGDGKEQSCLLTVDATSNLIYNNPIDFYVALNMDGISELNDWLGGVPVTIEDDFTAIDPAMAPGETVTLMGDQAELFVRERMSVGVGTNEARMDRQKAYLKSAQDVLHQKLLADSNAAEDMYDSLSSFFTTNMSRGRLINEVNRAVEYEVEDPVQPEGVHEIDNQGFMMFTVDENSLLDLIVSLYYEPIN